jgi:signal transduction histidine kinase
MNTLNSKYAQTPNGQGFLLRIEYGGTVLGLIAVDQLAFPQYCERYLNMALAVIDVCGLVIENARNRRRLVEAEKMASLGVLIAGVAHEINTPLGVGLTATTTLQQQGNRLAKRFGEHSMTQSELENYLKSATSATGLIQKNLERISLLIEAFSHVALDEVASTPMKTFLMKGCLDEVIRSLGSKLPADRVDINIHCDPDLEIESFRSDWVSIFINLISNSLKHGFKGHEHNTINIRIVGETKIMRIDYRDDGVGLAPESLARIFDPFFTTDLQQGTGLGLYLVYNLITQHMNGSIQCQSESGKGVYFHIEVPQ